MHEYLNIRGRAIVGNIVASQTIEKWSSRPSRDKRSRAALRIGAREGNRTLAISLEGFQKSIINQRELILF